MTKFTIYNKLNAPEASKKLLEESEKTYGMIPNLHGVMAESPEILEAYKAMGNFFSMQDVADASSNRNDSETSTAKEENNLERPLDTYSLRVLQFELETIKLKIDIVCVENCYKQDVSEENLIKLEELKGIYKIISDELCKRKKEESEAKLKLESSTRQYKSAMNNSGHTDYFIKYA